MHANDRTAASRLVAALFVAAFSASAVMTQEAVPKGQLVDGLAAAVDPTALYTLYLPRAYDPARRWPVLLVFDPRGRARLAAEIFQPAAERFGWVILSSNDSRSDGPWEPNQKAMVALWTQLERLSIDRKRIYATGFSGGAIVSWVLAQGTQEIAGIINVGGRLAPELPLDELRFVHFGAVGSFDFNYDEMQAIEELLEKRAVPHRLEIFDGPHSWPDASLAEEAVAWMELQAMRRELRPRDASLVEQLWREDVGRAEALLANGQGYAAQHRFGQIARSFEGLRDTTPATREADRLADDKAVKKERREVLHWDAVDERYARETLPRLFRLKQPGLPPSVADLGAELDLDRLLRQAAGQGYAAVAAKRMLQRVFTQASFYLHRDLVARGAHAAARVSLEIALKVNPSFQHVWYNLACAAAQAGDAKRALEALGEAIDRGFSSLEHLDADEDLDALRELESFRELRRRLTPQPAAGGETSTENPPG